MPPRLDSPAVRHGDHVVQFYEREADLVTGVGGYLIDAAAEAAVAVVIATGPHREAFVEHLEARGADTAGARRDGSLVLLDAAEVLERLTDGGGIDRDAFFEVIGGLIREAGRRGRPVRAYGEMVALLWEAGDVLAAIDLETLWNELAGELPFSLYCAYRSDAVAGEEHAGALHDVCRLHSAVLPDPGAVADVSADLPVHPDGASRARRLVADAVEAWGLGRALAIDAELVATELATNAIRHARTPFRVSAHRYGRVVRIEVRDRSTALPAVREPDPTGSSGRGMRMIGAIARRWGVDVDAGGKTVWAEIG